MGFDRPAGDHIGRIPQEISQDIPQDIPQEIVQEIEQEIVQPAVEQRDFSGVVYLRRGSDVLLARACGLAHRPERIPMRVDTRFEIASGAKSLTAVAAIRLIEQGRLSFDSRLCDVLDLPLPGFAPEITIAQILTHTSGMPDYADESQPDFDYEAIWRDLPVYRIRTARDCLPLLLQGDMKFAPGERFEYCNSGYVFVGLVIEAVCGEDFYTHMQREVLDPAGMRDSGYFESDRLPVNTAIGYIPLENGAGYRTNVFSIPARSGADGGLYASAPDLARFLDALRANRLTGEALTRELLRPHVDIDPETGSRYGYGFWFNRTSQGVERMAILGSDPGTECSCSFYPEHELQLVILTNVNDGLQDLRLRIEDVLFG
jgi:CubicO group peptidase (beta-lactamase class C family)